MSNSCNIFLNVLVPYFSELGELDEMWIQGFFRPSNNESMDENCRSIGPRIGINVRKTEEPGIFCLYYNNTDKRLHTDDCTSSKPFLCERKTLGKGLAC